MSTRDDLRDPSGVDQLLTQRLTAEAEDDIPGVRCPSNRYYHRSRTHLGLGKQCPIERAVMERGVIVEKAELGGLHHRYERLAA